MAAFANGYFDGYPDRNPHGYSYADDGYRDSDSYRDSDAVALSYEYGHTDEYDRAYRNPNRGSHCYGDSDGATTSHTDTNRHAHADAIADDCGD